MQQFTEEHAKLLLNKEWLVKVDSGKATPYFLKCHFSSADLSCCILLTDTKSVWAEAITSKLLARRWRACNPTSPEPFVKTDNEDAWRESTFELLSKAHTIGGISELSFDIIDSKYSDLALELECEAFKWQWETCFLGYQRSSEIISNHLIFPLISLTHLTFSSAEAVSELSDGDMEKTIDKLGRTARRTVDTHLKNALSKPRVATSIRRMTAMFNFTPDLPPVTSIAEKPILDVERIEQEPIPPYKSKSALKVTAEQRRTLSPPNPPVERTGPKRERSVEVQPESATESEEEPIGIGLPNSVGPSSTSDNLFKVQATPAVSDARVEQSSDSEQSPHRPAKKAKPAVPLSSDDSESGKNPSRSGSAAATAGAKRGTRQPIKRGGKRF